MAERETRLDEKKGKKVHQAAAYLEKSINGSRRSNCRRQKGAETGITQESSTTTSTTTPKSGYSSLQSLQSLAVAESECASSEAKMERRETRDARTSSLDRSVEGQGAEPENPSRQSWTNTWVRAPGRARGFEGCVEGRDRLESEEWRWICEQLQHIGLEGNDNNSGNAKSATEMACQGGTPQMFTKGDERYLEELEGIGWWVGG